MIINSKIKEMFDEIARESLSYGNEKDDSNKYIKRILSIYKKNLTEDEQIYLLRYLLEHVHFKNIATDPDTILHMHNIKLKGYIFLLMLTLTGILIGSLIVYKIDSIDHIFDGIMRLFKMLSIL